MFEKVSRSLKYDSNIFFVLKHIHIKKKALKINVKIEDVRLNELKKVRKQEMVTKFS